MAYNTIQIKRRLAGNGALPGAPASLSGGELAFNEVDSVLYYGAEEGASVIPIGGEGHFSTITTVASLTSNLQTQVSTLDSRVTSEVATLNTTIQSVSSTLDAKIDSSIAAVVDMAPEALNTLNELAAALGDDENFASNLVSTLGNVNSTMSSISSTLQSEIDSLSLDSSVALASLSAEIKGDLSTESAARIAADSALSSTVASVSSTLDSAIVSEAAARVAADSSISTTMASVSASLDSKIDSEVASLESSIASEVSTLNSTVASVSGDLTTALNAEIARATAAEGVLDSKIDSEVADLESAIASEVSTLNTTVQTVSSALASDLAAVNTRVDNVLSNVDAVALNSLAEIVDAFQEADDDLNGAITSLAGAASTQLASVSAALDSKIDSEVADLESAIASEVSALSAAIDTKAPIDNPTFTGNVAIGGGLNMGTIASGPLQGSAYIEDSVGTAFLLTDPTIRVVRDISFEYSVNVISAPTEDNHAVRLTDLNTAVDSVSAALASDLADEVTRATAAEGAISSLVSEISGNFLDKRVGGTVTGDLDVVGTISTTGGLEINGGGAATSLFVGDGVVGVNTETPSEAFEVVGNGKFSGTVEVAAPTVNGHAANKGYVDTAIANLVDGAPALLDTLNELAAAINNDESFAATIATNIGNVSTALASVSATLDSKIDSEVATLNSTITSEVATLNSTITSEVATLNSTISDEADRATAAEGALDTRVSDVENNYLDKRVGGSITGNVDVTGTGSYTGTVTVAEPASASHAATKNYVDVAISIIDGGTF